MQKIEINNNIYISYKQQKTNNKNAKTIVFLHGLMSDKDGSKSISIEEFCVKNGYNFFAFDNLGHGDSTGNFTDYSISSWVDAARRVISLLNLKNIIIIGSSMGGWLALLLGREKIKNVKAIILLAPAPDFTQKIWNSLSASERSRIETGEIINIKQSENFNGIPISYNLILGGRDKCLMHNEKISLAVPGIIIHGMEDLEVDYQVSLELAKKIENDYLVLKLLKYSGHRLSSENDLQLINNSIEELSSLF